MLGTRTNTGTKDSKGDTVFGEYVWKSWGEVDVIAKKIAKGLRRLDLSPITSGGPGERDRRFMCVWSKNRWEWFACMLGAWYVNTTVTGFYDTQGEEQIDYICNQLEMKSIFCEQKYLTRVIAYKK
jgi:long-subunit acyl-CoA synthetase (AMP-forming)